MIRFLQLSATLFTTASDKFTRIHPLTRLIAEHK